jgi:hypothetical protein
MSKSTAVWISVVVGVVLFGLGIFSIRGSFGRTRKSWRSRIHQVSSGARLYFPEGEGERVVVTLDSVGQTESVRHAFVFTNVGAEAVKISQVRVVKGEASVEDFPATVVPSNSGKIVVSLDPFGLTGMQESVIEVKSNDVDYPVRELVLRVPVTDSL